MADHYGDAEIIFGRYRSSSAYSDKMFAATKYCVFHPMTVSEEAVRANVGERCRRLNAEVIDLLQFHWQFYDDEQYIQALQYLQADPRVKQLGLCNFDTEHMAKVVESGVKIASNQVQFSLIDSRPLTKMASFCKTHGIKLLTYGTLLGGLLAESWIGLPPPDLYSEKTTPSQRKYYAMIRSWGGWALFQELLLVLRRIARKHGVSVSNVATRWVLDFECVGAVIVGARMGVSGRFEENLASLGWALDEADREGIEKVLGRSKRQEMFEGMGDCGGEYR
ncbi:NADP-dependent oxidoreductase domain-containing protein [Aspergillus heterothallicus]